MPLWLVGYPGSGKGDQGKHIREAIGCPAIVLGDICRFHVGQGSELGKTIETYSSQGELVPDDIVLHRVCRPVLDLLPRGVRLDDGLPRNLVQYKQMMEWTSERNDGDVIVFNIDVKRETAFERMLGRGRMGETPDVINRRLDIYEEDAKILIPEMQADHVQRRIALINIDGEPPADEVFQHQVYPELEKLGLVRAQANELATANN
jgi:adenylate kinase